MRETSPRRRALGVLARADRPMLPEGDLAGSQIKRALREMSLEGWVRWQSAPRRNRSSKRWYPIECEHGYDCCPTCDGQRHDTITLHPLDCGYVITAAGRRAHAQFEAADAYNERHPWRRELGRRA